MLNKNLILSNYDIIWKSKSNSSFSINLWHLPRLGYSFHTPSDLKLYSDGYLQALRNCSSLEQKDQEKLERLIERWILDPSSFIDPDGDGNKGFFDKKRI